MLVLKLVHEKLPLLRNQSTFQRLEQTAWKDTGCSMALCGTWGLASVCPDTEEYIVTEERCYIAALEV